MVCESKHVIVNLIFNPVNEFEYRFELFNLMLNHNFNLFIESLIYPFLHVS